MTDYVLTEYMRSIIKEDADMCKLVSEAEDLPLITIKIHREELNWDYISKYNKNIVKDFDFIKEFSDRLNWDYISKYQTLSDDFIKEFENELDIID